MLKTKITNKAHRKEFYDFLKGCNSTGHPNSTEIRYIVDKLNLHNIPQVFLDYGEDTLRCILDFFEEKEYYEFCQLIVEKTEVFSKSMRININLKKTE